MLALRSGLFAALLCAAAAHAQDDPGAEAGKLADAIAPSLVQVEYHLKHDGGDAPEVLSGRWTSWYARSSRELIEQRLPLPVGGYLLGPTRVVSADVMIHPRFIDKIVVKQGEHAREAKLAAVGVLQDAVMLDLASPLPAGKPLEFKADAPGPFAVVSYSKWPWTWVVGVKPLSADAWFSDLGERVLNLGEDALIVGKGGAPVAMCLTGELHLERPWRGSPQEWELLAADQLAALTSRLEGEWSKGVARVSMTFRSPRGGGGMRARMMQEQNALTEWSGVGVVTDEKTVLVLATLNADTTARLERIQLHAPDGTAVPLTFGASLADFGALVARSDAKLPVPAVKLDAGDVRAHRDRLTLVQEVLVQGERVTRWSTRSWFTSLDQAEKGRVLPELPDTSAQRDQRGGGPQGVRGGLFLYDRQGGLLALPLAKRDKVSMQQRWYHEGQVRLTPSTYVLEALRDLAKSADPQNVPLSEEDEGRLGWLGVELQEMDQDLARQSGVAHLTNDGATGGLISHVHANSPAAKVGLQPGDVLLRIHAADQPRPIELQLDQDPSRYMMGDGFPWDRLDEVPEEYFEHIPQPWPTAETSFNRALTDLGIGSAYVLEAWRNGELVKFDLKVEAMPPHYGAAKRFKSQALGLTVSPCTYEVRRYFQMTDDAPGVVVAAVEMGGKASIGGVKPYEVITHVNDTPVATVADFEKLIAQGGELRLQIKRMHRGRLVKIKS